MADNKSAGTTVKFYNGMVLSIWGKYSLILHLKGPRLPKKASAVHTATV